MTSYAQGVTKLIFIMSFINFRTSVANQENNDFCRAYSGDATETVSRPVKIEKWLFARDSLNDRLERGSTLSLGDNPPDGFLRRLHHYHHHQQCNGRNVAATMRVIVRSRSSSRRIQSNKKCDALSESRSYSPLFPFHPCRLRLHSTLRAELLGRAKLPEMPCVPRCLKPQSDPHARDAANKMHGGEWKIDDGKSWRQYRIARASLAFSLSFSLSFPGKFDSIPLWERLPSTCDTCSRSRREESGLSDDIETEDSEVIITIIYRYFGIRIARVKNNIRKIGNPGKNVFKLRKTKYLFVIVI